MVVSGPLPKQQTADRFQQIKKEVNEIIRAHFSQLNSKVDFGFVVVTML